MRLINLKKIPHNTDPKHFNLQITLTGEGRQELQELLADHPERDAMHELLEFHLCNGWDTLNPEDIGALTSCPLILSEEVERDDNGKVTNVGQVYWHPNYMIEDPVKTLLEKGKVYAGRRIQPHLE